MLTALSIFSLAQLTAPVLPSPPPAIGREIIQSQEVRSLPGQLDEIPVFNSNSPELIQTEGILLSTFPPDGMAIPSAHINFPFTGRFDLFAHHIARGFTPDDTRTLYLGVIIHNPGPRTATVDILQAVSYLGQDAPFKDLPATVANPLGTVFSGPGSRTMNDVLRAQRQVDWPPLLVLAPGDSKMLVNVPIPLRRLAVPTNGTLLPGQIILPPRQLPPAVSINGGANGASSAGVGSAPAGSNSAAPVIDRRPLPTNGRSLLMRLWSSDPVYVASLAMFAPTTVDGNERVPTLAEWNGLLADGGLSGPRDFRPTPLDRQDVERFFYGRVAGVSQGTQWLAQLTDADNQTALTIPQAGQQFSYVISTVNRNTFGTGQVQSALMLARYGDTAYRAHGNYGIKYSLTLPLYNSSDQMQTVTLALQTPLQDETLREGLRFLESPEGQIFFRGTVRIRFTDDFGVPQTRYLHLVQRRGQQGQPLVQLRMPPGDRRLTQVEFLYPPDATPPQVLTVRTLENDR